MRQFILFWMFFPVLLSCYGPGLNALNSSQEFMEPPYDNSRRVTVDDVRIHYRHWKQPEEERKGSCLLLHGFGASTYSWQEVADSLHQIGYEVVAVDLPPFGYSDKSDGINQSVTAHALRLKKLTGEALPGRRWHLAGHSMGGSVAQAFALQYPKQLRSVTFVSAVLFPSLEDEPRPARALLRLSPLRFLLGEFAEEWVITRRRVEDMLESAYGMPPDEDQVEAYLRPLQIPGTARAILAAAAFHEELVSLDAARLEVPALAIWGDSDTWIPVESREKVLERMPGTELSLLEGVGHNPMETHFNDYMRSWIPFLEAHDN
ncbi:MAG: alpha/beta fold hydrolase [Bacteroidales bacterium]